MNCHEYEITTHTVTQDSIPFVLSAEDMGNDWREVYNTPEELAKALGVALDALQPLVRGEERQIVVCGGPHP